MFSAPLILASAADLSATLQRLSFMESILKATSVGPFTVQDGGANPLLAFDTSSLKPCTAIVSDLGGCGPSGSAGPGLVEWNGTRWVRLSRGTQKSLDPAATITLDYWKDSQRAIITGTSTSSTRILLANAPTGALYSIGKPGLVGALVTAFNVNMAGNAANTDLTLVGPAIGYFEVAAGTLSQVQSS